MLALRAAWKRTISASIARCSSSSARTLDAGTDCQAVQYEDPYGDLQHIGPKFRTSEWTSFGILERKLKVLGGLRAMTDPNYLERIIYQIAAVDDMVPEVQVIRVDENHSPDTPVILPPQFHKSYLASYNSYTTCYSYIEMRRRTITPHPDGIFFYCEDDGKTDEEILHLQAIRCHPELLRLSCDFENDEDIKRYAINVHKLELEFRKKNRDKRLDEFYVGWHFPYGRREDTHE